MSIPPASILGIGAVTPLGRDLELIRQRLHADRSPSPGTPGEGRGDGDFELQATLSKSNHPHALPAYRERGQEVLRVSDDLLSDPATASQLRRADRFTRMAVIAARDAWNAAKQSCAGIAPERIALIVSSGFGPHCRGFRFLDGILDAGDTAASPTDFSHSVHGAASAYISRLLDIRGPALNATDFEMGFEETIRIAQCWLNENACDRVLIGAVEELGEVLLSCAARMLNVPTSPSEGAVFLMLGPAAAPGVATLDAIASPVAVDLLIVEDPPILQTKKTSSTLPAKRTVTFTPCFGHSASSTAFALLGGLLSMQTIDTAATLRTSSEGLATTLFLEKYHG